MSEQVRATGLASFEQDVLAESRQRPVVVDFWASWCGPCKTLGPILEQVAQGLAGKVRVLKVDTDAEQQLAARFQIRSIPTVILFRDGKPAAQFVGVQPEQAIREWIRPFLPADVSPLRSGAATARRQGNLDRARDLLEQLLAAQPDDPEARADLVEVELAAGDAAAARTHLGLLAPDYRDSERGRVLEARLFFADELAESAAGTSDLDGLYAEGLKAAASGANARAAEAFLTLIQRSRAFREDVGRRALLRLFDLLGAGDPLVQDSRRRLAQLLH